MASFQAALIENLRLNKQQLSKCPSLANTRPFTAATVSDCCAESLQQSCIASFHIWLAAQIVLSGRYLADVFVLSFLFFLSIADLQILMLS